MKYPRNLTPILFAIAIIAVFGAMLIGNNLGALKPVFAQAPTPTTASTTLVFASQDNPSVVATDDESYTFTISESAAVANASVGTIPPAILWNADSTLRANYKISTDTSSGHGADHDKFDIHAITGEITIATSQTTLPGNIYRITLKGEVYQVSNDLEKNSTVGDTIDEIGRAHV